MRGSTIDIVVILAISLLVAPLAVEAQPAGKVYRIGILGLGPFKYQIISSSMRISRRDNGFTRYHSA